MNEEISRRCFLKKAGLATGLAGLVGMGVFGGRAFGASTSQPTSRPASQPATEPTTQPAVSERDVAYVAIKEVLISDFLEDYLDRVTSLSGNFQKLRKKYGRSGLLERYVDSHVLFLDLARDAVGSAQSTPKAGTKIDDKKYVGLGKELAKRNDILSKSVGGHVNHLDKKVVQAYIAWGENKTEFFMKLFGACEGVEIPKGIGKSDSVREKYVKQLINKAFTRKGYLEYIQRFNKGSDVLYDAMTGTLGWGKTGFPFYGEEKINKIRKCTRQVYNDTIEKYFPKNLNKDKGEN